MMILNLLFTTTQKHTIKFSSTRRLEGSFYSYNYGVYSEIGVNGHTDKKNWIGWSKTESNELRVGWRDVVLKCKVPDYYAETMKDLNSMLYNPPQYMLVNGQRINVVTLMMPDFKPDLKDKLWGIGVKGIYDVLKNQLGNPLSGWEKAQAVIIATRTEVYFYPPSEDIIKYNTKSYTHVFAKDLIDFEIGYNSQTGIFINGVNQNNYNKIGTYFSTITAALNEKKPTLEKGTIYCCARLGTNWRGMRILKE